jgi:hypothetical protein
VLPCGSSSPTLSIATHSLPWGNDIVDKCSLVLKGKAKRVIHTRYESADEFAAIELIAERHRRTHQGDGFRVHDMHTDQLTERLNLGS